MRTGGKREASGSKCLSVASQDLGGGAVYQGLHLGPWRSTPNTSHFCVWETNSPFCCCSPNLFQFLFVCVWARVHMCVCVCTHALACGDHSLKTGATSPTLFTEVGGSLRQTQAH